jgi:hypothetical protein
VVGDSDHAKLVKMTGKRDLRIDKGSDRFV